MHPNKKTVVPVLIAAVMAASAGAAYSASAKSPSNAPLLSVLSEPQLEQDLLPRSHNPSGTLEEASTRLIHRGHGLGAWVGTSAEFGTCLLVELNSAGEWMVGVTCAPDAEVEKSGVRLRVEMFGLGRFFILVPDHVDELWMESATADSGLTRIAPNLFEILDRDDTTFSSYTAGFAQARPNV